jgi:hypothetical protein
LNELGAGGGDLGFGAGLVGAGTQLGVDERSDSLGDSFGPIDACLGGDRGFLGGG